MSTWPVTLPMTSVLAHSRNAHITFTPSVARLKWTTSFTRAPPMRNPGHHGAKAKVATLRTAGLASEPITRAQTPNPARAQPNVSGRVTAVLMTSACDTRSSANRWRRRLSETTRHAARGRTRDSTGRISARLGAANQRAIPDALRESATQHMVASDIVIQKQVSISRFSRLRNWIIAEPRPISARIPAIPVQNPARAIRP